VIDAALFRARTLVAEGDDMAARQAYLDALRLDPQHPAALTEFGALAHAGGFVSAARTAYREAVRCWPDDTLALAGYGDLLNEAGDPEAACVQYRAALTRAPDMPRAHQGLARALQALGRDAGEHWRKGFTGQAVARRRYRGVGAGIPLLLLVSATGGNVPTGAWIDDRIFTVTAIYADFHDPADPLPPHALIVNAVGDADLCHDALANVERIVARSAAPVINPPSRVRMTGRETMARRAAGLPGVIAPVIARLSQAESRYPLLLRAAGYHTGQHFVRVEHESDLAAAIATLPDADPLAITCLDARGPDGMARKYRVMFIDGAAFPLHLAISADWKVHYFTAAMAANPAFRAEEKEFLDDMPTVLGRPAMLALSAIQTALGLDYGGIDFGLSADGTLLLFEANATMVINPPEADPIWDYRRPAVAAARDAAQRMLAERVVAYRTATGR
jgi:hypothetical protein